MLISLVRKLGSGEGSSKRDRQWSNICAARPLTFAYDIGRSQFDYTGVVGHPPCPSPNRNKKPRPAEGGHFSPFPPSILINTEVKIIDTRRPYQRKPQRGESIRTPLADVGYGARTTQLAPLRNGNKCGTQIPRTDTIKGCRSHRYQR